MIYIKSILISLLFTPFLVFAQTQSVLPKIKAIIEMPPGVGQAFPQMPGVEFK